MRIYTKTGVMDITLHFLGAPIEGNLAFVGKDIDTLVDIAFLSEDGVKRYPVSGAIGNIVAGGLPDIVFGDVVFCFVTGPELEYWWDNLESRLYTWRGDLEDKYPSFEMPFEAPDGVIVDIYDVFPELREEVRWRRK